MLGFYWLRRPWTTNFDLLTMHMVLIDKIQECDWLKWFHSFLLVIKTFGIVIG